jgi:DNA (cytosine-5)-methyltransferase 1
MRPKLLDLFCGAGGAAVGYHRAGFDVVGVDIKPQKNYPFRFVQADAMTLPFKMLGRWFDAIHASPPCEGSSRLHYLRPDREYPDLITPTRAALKRSGLPYVIENVPGAPLIHPRLLCGSSFGLPIWRHRLFESNFMLMAFPCSHGLVPEPLCITTKRHAGKRFKIRNPKDVAEQRQAMGMEHGTRYEVGKAIPPAFTEFIGKQLMGHLR